MQKHGGVSIANRDDEGEDTEIAKVDLLNDSSSSRSTCMSSAPEESASETMVSRSVDGLSHVLSRTILPQDGSIYGSRSRSPSPDIEGMSQLRVHTQAPACKDAATSGSTGTSPPPHDMASALDPSPSPSPSKSPSTGILSPAASNLPSPAPTNRKSCSCMTSAEGEKKDRVFEGGMTGRLDDDRLMDYEEEGVDGGKGNEKGTGEQKKVEGVAVMPFPARANKEYRCIQSIGAGSYGEVYKAVRRSDQKLLAVKVLEGDQWALEEASILRKLDHEYICKLYDCFECPEDGVTCLVMQYASGGDLLERITNSGPLTEPAAVELCTQLLEALKHMHGKGVVHRDLKPENILYSHNGKPLLADFGVGKRLRASLPPENDPVESLLTGELRGAEGSPAKPGLRHLTLSDVVIRTHTQQIGTLGYSAPEVNTDEGHSFAADIWSLGAMFYVLLCGYHPFDMGDDEPDVIQERVRKGEVLAMEGEAWVSISDEAKSFVSRCLVVDVRERATLAECLAHPWLKKDFMEVVELVGAFARLQVYHSCRKESRSTAQAEARDVGKRKRETSVTSDEGSAGSRTPNPLHPSKNFKAIMRQSCGNRGLPSTAEVSLSESLEVSLSEEDTGKRCGAGEHEGPDDPGMSAKMWASELERLDVRKGERDRGLLAPMALEQAHSMAADGERERNKRGLVERERKRVHSVHDAAADAGHNAMLLPPLQAHLLRASSRSPVGTESMTRVDKSLRMLTVWEGGGAAGVGASGVDADSTAGVGAADHIMHAAGGAGAGGGEGFAGFSSQIHTPTHTHFNFAVVRPGWRGEAEAGGAEAEDEMLRHKARGKRGGGGGWGEEQSEEHRQLDSLEAEAGGVEAEDDMLRHKAVAKARGKRGGWGEEQSEEHRQLDSSAKSTCSWGGKGTGRRGGEQSDEFADTQARADERCQPLSVRDAGHTRAHDAFADTQSRVDGELQQRGEGSSCASGQAAARVCVSEGGGSSQKSPRICQKSPRIRQKSPRICGSGQASPETAPGDAGGGGISPLEMRVTTTLSGAPGLTSMHVMMGANLTSPPQTSSHLTSPLMTGFGEAHANLELLSLSPSHRLSGGTETSPKGPVEGERGVGGIDGLELGVGSTRHSANGEMAERCNRNRGGGERDKGPESNPPENSATDPGIGIFDQSAGTSTVHTKRKQEKGSKQTRDGGAAAPQHQAKKEPTNKVLLRIKSDTSQEPPPSESRTRILSSQPRGTALTCHTQGQGGEHAELPSGSGSVAEREREEKEEHSPSPAPERPPLKRRPCIRRGQTPDVKRTVSADAQALAHVLCSACSRVVSADAQAPALCSACSNTGAGKDACEEGMGRPPDTPVTPTPLHDLLHLSIQNAPGETKGASGARGSGSGGNSIAGNSIAGHSIAGPPMRVGGGGEGGVVVDGAVNDGSVGVGGCLGGGMVG